MDGVRAWWESLGGLVASGVLLSAAALAALTVHWIGVRLVSRLPSYRRIEASVLRSTRRPGRWFVALAAMYVVVPLAPLRPAVAEPLIHGLLVAVIVAGAWLLVGATQVTQVFIESRYRSDVADNLRARRVQTKVRLLRRLVATVVLFVAFALILMTFEPVRRIGVSLFASAGVAGLVIGVAAQPTLSNLVAGLQLALTEPIRLDDVVIVEGEWGWIEEINMTYVVVRIWDQRRLVVPLRWFIENPFENWTRQTADILGPVVLYLDYGTPIDALRQELERIVNEEGDALWDHRVCGLQVVDATERTIKVRALVSAATSPQAWDLRCLVRERLVAWLREHHPEALPRVRVVEEGGREMRVASAGPPAAAEPEE